MEIDYAVAFRGVSGGTAEFSVRYAITFRYLNGRVVPDRACETYRVREDGGVWLIVENVDYVPC